MKRMKSLLAISTVALLSQSLSAYDVVNRYKIIDDKLKTEQMLRPFGHDFLIDIGAGINKNVTGVVKDISDASKGGTLASAQAILLKYDKTEQTVKVNLTVGIPIFSFSAWDLKVQPNIRANVDFGANLGIRTSVLSPSDILDMMNITIPAELKTIILSHTYTAGQDILDPANDGALCASLTDPVAQGICTAEKGKYFYPDATTPDMFMFAKLDGKVGLFNDYTYGEHFFGNFNLYGMVRTDIYQRINAKMISTGSKIELPKKANNETTMQADYRLGYQNSNYTVFVSVEELKLNKMKARDPLSKEQTYGYDPLLRLHADATYKYSALSLQPFFGFHKRSGYGFSDGVYGGAAVGAHVWGERLGLQLRGMLDKQYITISPRLKLWLMQLEYSMKAPVKSTDGDVKLSAIHSLDFRLFF